MAVRRPARLLAPLALVVVAIAVVVTVRNQSSGGSSAQPPAAGRSQTSSPPASRPPARHRRTPRRRSYTVKPGDSLSTIAARTGVPLARIERLNPGLDPKTLVAGQRLKLSP